MYGKQEQEQSGCEVLLKNPTFLKQLGVEISEMTSYPFHQSSGQKKKAEELLNKLA